MFPGCYKLTVLKKFSFANLTKLNKIECDFKIPVLDKTTEKQEVRGLFIRETKFLQVCAVKILS